jgi:hypothetical protein
MAAEAAQAKAFPANSSSQLSRQTPNTAQPLSAIVAKHEVMKNQKPGSMGGTYCMSACAVFGV